MKQGQEWVVAEKLRDIIGWLCCEGYFPNVATKTIIIIFTNNFAEMMKTVMVSHRNLYEYTSLHIYVIISAAISQVTLGLT